jgi:hypothetical protein
MAHLQRNGVPAMLQVAKTLCRLIVKFTPILLVQFPENTTLQSALAAANAACAALAAQLALVREMGD